MKKVFVFTLICLALFLLVPGVVSAEDSQEPSININQATASQSSTTNVTFGFAALYQLNVPDDFELSTRQIVYEEVSISNALLDPRTKVVVNISSPNYDDEAVDDEAAWRMKYVGNDGSSTINVYLPYHLHKAELTGGVPKYIEGTDGKVVSDEELFSVCAEELVVDGSSCVQYLAFILEAGDIRFAGQYKDTISFSAEIVSCTADHQSTA